MDERGDPASTLLAEMLKTYTWSPVPNGSLEFLPSFLEEFGTKNSRFYPACFQWSSVQLFALIPVQSHPRPKNKLECQSPARHTEYQLDMLYCCNTLACRILQ